MYTKNIKLGGTIYTVKYTKGSTAVITEIVVDGKPLALSLCMPQVLELLTAQCEETTNVA